MVHLRLLSGLDRECVAYSIGIADNWIFDDLMLERGCVVRSFDPTMVKFPPEHYARSDRHKFEAIGVGAESRVETRGGDTTRNYGGKAVYAVETLDDMMTRHGHARLSVLRPALVQLHYIEGIFFGARNAKQMFGC